MGDELTGIGSTFAFQNSLPHVQLVLYVLKRTVIWKGREYLANNLFRACHLMASRSDLSSLALGDGPRPAS